MGLPDLDVVRREDQPLPIESLPVSTSQGVSAAAESSLLSTLGASVVTKTIANSPYLGNMQHGDVRGTTPVTKQKAQQFMKDNGYDPAVLPDRDMTVGELAGIANQQSIIKRDQETMQDARLSGFTRNTSQLAGGLADPLFLLGGPILGETLAAGTKGLPLISRAFAGAGEGALLGATYDVGLKHFGTAPGDADIDTYQMAHDALWGSLLGAGTHAVFGPKAGPAEVKQGPQDMLARVASLERTDAAAKHLSIPVDDVISPAGAVGKYQVTPIAAEDVGMKGANLKDPAVNKEVAQKYLDRLAHQFGNDPEAIAIAYNAGPSRAAEWIKAGRNDAVLPKETQDYVNRLRKQQGPSTQAMEDQARKSVVEAANDSEPFRTNPFKLADEHDDEMRAIETQAMQEAFKPNTLFHNDPDILDLKRRMGFEEAEPAKPTSQTASPVVPPEVEDMHVQEAQRIAERAGETEQFEAEMQRHEQAAATEQAGLADSEYKKGVESALRCGIVKGLE